MQPSLSRLKVPVSFKGQGEGKSDRSGLHRKGMGAPRFCFGLFWILDSRQSSVGFLPSFLDASDALILEEF